MSQKKPTQFMGNFDSIFNRNINYYFSDFFAKSSLKSCNVFWFIESCFFKNKKQDIIFTDEKLLVFVFVEKKHKNIKEKYKNNEFNFYVDEKCPQNFHVWENATHTNYN